MAKTNERRIQTLCIRQSLLERRGNEIFNRRIGIAGRGLGNREIPILPIPETGPIIFGPSSTCCTTTKKKQGQPTIQRTANKRLDRLNHFDISLNRSAGKEIKFTDYVSRNPLEKKTKSEGNYEEVILVNAIAQLATVSARIGRIFNQSQVENTVNQTNPR